MWESHLGNLTVVLVTLDQVNLFGGGFHHPGGGIFGGVGRCQKIVGVDHEVDEGKGLRRVGSRFGMDRVKGFARTWLSLRGARKASGRDTS